MVLHRLPEGGDKERGVFILLMGIILLGGSQ